jgi:hypothetical protein
MMRSGVSLLLSIIILVFSASAGYGQSPAYAKFDASSATIGLYNLLPDATGCEASRRFSGTIKSVSRELSHSVYAYRFTLTSNPRVQFTFGVTEREILPAAVGDLIAKNRRVEVRARLCGSGGIWTAEEIKRL